MATPWEVVENKDEGGRGRMSNHRFEFAGLASIDPVTTDPKGKASIQLEIANCQLSIVNINRGNTPTPVSINQIMVL
jgi:hypothetical protein